MKKFMIRAVSLALTLMMVLSAPVIAKADNINLGVSITTGTDVINVTVDSSTGSNRVLAEQKPTLTIPCNFSEAYVKIGKVLVPSSLAGGKITFEVHQGGTYTVCRGSASQEFTEVPADTVIANPESGVEIDGLPIQADRNGNLQIHKDSELMVSSDYHVGDPDDRHTQYPTAMHVWILEKDDQGRLTSTRVEALDNILQYSGTSIRITGKQGIRMITSINQEKKNALVAAGLADYKLLEYGTAVCWASDLEGGKPMVLGQSYVKSNYAYKRNVADPVFKTAGDLMQYTNVLVGFTLDQCKDDIAMRPYMILEGPNGDQVTIYGGIIYRSIGYIAYRNRNAFGVGTDAYNYVWNIIHHVYGNQYDADYKG